MPPTELKLPLPHKFLLRPYQTRLFKRMDTGTKRAVIVWHRRSGKDKSCVNLCAKKSYERVGAYYYFMPTYAQAKKAIWDGKDRDGFPFMGHFPQEIIASNGKNESELKLKLRNGSIFQLVGTDNIDSVMSTNPIGCVFGEYALQDPRAWDYVRPILRENGGWAVFNFTPRGKNHGYQIYELARRLESEGHPDWFCQRLTVDDTHVLSPADIDQERREGMDEEMIQQEYYCSFEGAQQGSYFGRQMMAADTEERICGVPWEPECLVDTWWDLGVEDATAIWFTQNVGREVHVIDYYEQSGEGFPHYAKVLRDKPYDYGTHNAPHDIAVRELGSGKNRLETAASLGIKFDIVPNIGVQDGIDAARSFLARCWFDRTKTERGRLALLSYHKTWDEKRRMFSSQPYHDWSSNGADAFRYLAVGHKISVKQRANATARRVMTLGAGGTSWLGA